MNAVASYVYADESGTAIARVDRVEPGRDGCAKDFFPYLWDPATGRFSQKPGLNGTKLPLYRVNEVRAAIAGGQRIYLVEGEGKADRLRASLRETESCAAVTAIFGGANAPFRTEHVAALAGARQIVILADSDRPGGCAAAVRAEAIFTAHPDADVRIVDLFPDREDGSDIADWFDEGRSIDELLARTRAAQSIVPPPAARAPSTGTFAQTGGSNDFVRAGELIAEPDAVSQYLVTDRLAVGGSAIIVGKPKAGKSTVAANLALSVARGEPFLGSETVKRPVLYVALEGPRNEWKLLLRSLGVTAADELYFFIGRAPKDAVVWLREHVDRHKPGLIIIDTLQRFTRVKDTSDYAQISNATDALIELTRLSGAAIVYVHHGGKSDKADLVDAPLGSTAIAGSVDSVFVVKRSRERRTIGTVQRYGVDLDESVIEMDPISHHVTLTGSKKDADVGSAVGLIAIFLREQLEPVEEPVIREAIDIRKSVQVAALRSMVDAGQVVRLGGGRKGDSYRYKLPENFSGSLVPGIGAEPENHNPKTGVNAHRYGLFSGSHSCGDSGAIGTINTEARNHNSSYGLKRLDAVDDDDPLQGALDL